MNTVNITIVLAAAALALASAAMAGTQESTDTAQAHQGHAAHEPAPAPVLAEGQRWATDAPLREAMLRIREGVASRMHAFHEGSLPAAEAQSLAAAVEADVQYMIANCRLEPQPDAALHALIGRMLGSAEALRADPADPGGMPELVSVVRDYGATFNHPGWDPL
jgi:hypothetical protein